MAVVYDDYLNQAKSYWDPERKKEEEKIKSVSEMQKKSVTDIYNKQSDDTEVAYEDNYRENAVQKLINEREVAENMANLGLTDSGLNRTQQTAVQLSYANNKGQIDRQKQAQLDTIATNLAAELSSIEQTLLSDIAANDEKYNGYITNMANEGYSAAKQAEADIETARINAEADITKEAWRQSLNNNSQNVLYTYQGATPDKTGYNNFIDSNGKVRQFEIGINPYTGANNNKVYAAEKEAGVKFSSNGYQPLGLASEGGNFDALKVNGVTVKYNKYGKNQTIWISKTGKYFYWNGEANSYELVPNDFVEQIKEQYK